MIDKSEIDAKSEELGVRTSDVQRDYVFGWLLSGMYYAAPQLTNALSLKGGKSFRKGYFEHARYSNDLDFSTQTEVDPVQLGDDINKMCEYVGDKTGVKFALDENKVAVKRGADEEDKTYEARVYFKGFYGEEHYNIKVKMDVKEFDRIFLPIQTRSGIVGIKMYTEDKVESIETTDETFEPRCPIELSKAGEHFGQTYFSKPLSSAPRTSAHRVTSRNTRARSSFGMSYTVVCSVCNKRFKRSSYSTKLNKHKDRFGNQCYGRYGYNV